MGLAERRAAKQFEIEKLPKLQTDIDHVAGFEVPLEINWIAIAADGYADQYNEFFYKVYFLPLIEALKGICIDDMGKEALKDGLKKVLITNESSSRPAFRSGILTLPYNSIANIDYWMERKKDIQAVLENGL
jgi:hypothetical protein